MKYIKELTEEQKREIPNHNKKWIEIGLKTGETDWKTFEENIKIAYKKAGIVFPNKIIRVSSPIVGALAASISEAIYKKYIRSDAIRGAVTVVVSEAVSKAVGDIVKEVVDDATNDAVSEAVYSAINGVVGGTVENAGNGVVDDAIDGAVSSAADVAVNDAVGRAVDIAVSGAVSGAVGREAGREVDDVVYGEVSRAVNGAVDVAVSETVSDAVRDASKIIKKLGLNIKWHHWFGGQFWVGYWYGSAFKDFFINVCGLELSNDIIERFNCYSNLNKSANYFWTNRDFVIVCARPTQIHKNEKGQLHCENDMAIKYKDGWGLWMLNGVKVNKYIVMTPAEEIDCNIILKEKNVEVRKEIIKKVGIDRVIEKLGAKCIEKNNVYELLNFDCIDGRFRPYLKMLNPSTGDYHVEGVHPECTTIEKALAWRNGLTIYEEPVILT